jgi:hypothetical protein
MQRDALTFSTKVALVGAAAPTGQHPGGLRAFATDVATSPHMHVACNGVHLFIAKGPTVWKLRCAFITATVTRDRFAAVVLWSISCQGTVSPPLLQALWSLQHMHCVGLLVLRVFLFFFCSHLLTTQLQRSRGGANQPAEVRT